MSLLTDLQTVAEHLSPSDVTADIRVVGALVKVLEHNGLTVPAVEELLPEEHPARVSPPAPASPAQQDESRLARIEAALERLAGLQTSPAAPVQVQADEQAGSETVAPSSEPAAPAVEPAPQAERSDAPELDRP